MSPSEYAELVEFLGRQFTAIDQRFTAIDQRFAAIDGRFAAIDGRFDVVDRSIAELRGEMLGHFDEIYRRLERLEQEYHAITQALRRIEAGVAGERGRREILERDLAELKEQVSVLQSRIEEIEARLGR
jgi:chromosome segregation ATPase